MDPFTVNHFCKWAEQLELDNGEKWVVEDYFARFVEDVFAGFPIAWLIVPEGNAKTTGIAGLELYHCEFRRRAFVPWAASARDQAEIGYSQAKLFVESMPKARRPRCFDGYRRIEWPDGSRIQIFAAGAEHADGVIPTQPTIDELHRHKNLSLYRTWVGKLRKRGGQLLVISTAGEPGSEFELARAKIRSEATEVVEAGAFGRYATARVVMHEYAVREESMIWDVGSVKDANPFSLITEQSLEEKRNDPTMTERHWKRFTCNIATLDDGTDPYIDGVEWDSLADPGLEAAEGEIVCLGADGSRTWDTTVVAWAWALPEGCVGVDARVFSVRPNVAHHVLHEGGKIDFDDVEAFVVSRFQLLEVAEVAYDPRYLDRSMEIVAKRLNEGVIFAVEPQSASMREALQTMVNLAAEGKLRHPGDEVLTAHVVNAGAQRGYSNEIRRVGKIDSQLPVDAVPAMALAVWRAARRMREPESVYEERGLLVL